MSSIISRSQWGARHQDGYGNRPVGRLEKYLHHTVTATLPDTATLAQDIAQIRTVESIGQNRFGAGMSYTFLVTPAGRVFQGVSTGRISAHSGAGRNTRGVGICLVGNFDTNKPSAKQIAAVVWLLQEGVRRKWWGDPALTEMHRDFRSTACPGKNAADLFADINRRGRGAQSESKPTPPASAPKPKPKPAPKPSSPAHVAPNATLTKRMDAMGYPRQRWMKDRVKRFQESQRFGGLVADGHWGPVTEAHYQWVRRLQSTMNRWKGNKIAVDGDYRSQTQNRVTDLMRRNHGGAYKGIIDGVPGPIFCGMLGIPTHPGR